MGTTAADLVPKSRDSFCVSRRAVITRQCVELWQDTQSSGQEQQRFFLTSWDNYSIYVYKRITDVIV